MPPKDDDFIRALDAEFAKNYERLLRMARGRLVRRAGGKADQEAEDLVNAAYMAIRDRRTYDPKYTLESFIFYTVDSLAKDIPRSAWVKKKTGMDEPTGDKPSLDSLVEEEPPSDRKPTVHGNAEQLLGQKEEAELYDRALQEAIEHFGDGSVEAKYITALRDGVTDAAEHCTILAVEKAELRLIADRVEYRIEKIIEEKEKQQRVSALKLLGKKKS